MPKDYRVTLTPEQREALRQLLAGGRAFACTQPTLPHARVLLKADEAATQLAWSDAAIAAMLEISEPTTCWERQRSATLGFDAALHRKHRDRRWEPKLDRAQEAHLIDLARSEAPEGRDRWSLRLLAEKMVQLGRVEEVSYETLRRVLNRGNSNLG